MIFVTLDDPSISARFERSQKNIIYGAKVATGEFYRALIQYGSFDEYHFFLTKPLPQNFFNNKRVKFKRVEEIPFYLQNTRYTVFFTSEPCLADISYLRNQYAHHYFPICGITYTISYQQQLENGIFNNLLSDLYPFDSIICISTATLRTYRNLIMLVKKSFLKEEGLCLEYRARLDHLPLGINVEDYGNVDKFKARDKLNLPKNKIILLYFGRFSISDKMDLYPLLVTFKNVLSKNKSVILLLAGKSYKGGYATRVKRLAKDMGIASQVRFCLSPSLKRKYLLYSASDIFVSPSDNIQESFGLTVLEAMASGLPVVVSDWDGYRDIVVQGKTGFKIPTYWMNCDRDINYQSRLFSDFHRDHLFLSQSVYVDVGKMTECLSILVRSKDLRQRFGDEARKRVLEKYDWRILIPRYERLWKRLSVLSENYKIEKKKRGIFTPKYFSSFHHYASELINKNTKISISPDGILALNKDRFPRILSEMQYMISIRIVFMILSYLLEKKTSKVEEVQNYIKTTLKKVSADNIRYHIMWLLKKNFIVLGSKR